MPSYLTQSSLWIVCCRIQVSLHKKNSFWFPSLCFDFIVTTILQNILEKFEFFPIKCRVQRSLEIFQKAQEQTAMHKGRQFTQKVSWLPPVPAIPEAVSFRSSQFVLVSSYIRTSRYRSKKLATSWLWEWYRVLINIWLARILWL